MIYFLRIQILQVKIRRLEYLLQLKDLRINERKNQQQPVNPSPNQKFSQHFPQGYHNNQFPPHLPRKSQDQLEKTHENFIDDTFFFVN